MSTSILQASVIPATRVVELIASRTDATRKKPLLIYLHVPFCTSKCHFCGWVVGYDKKQLTAQGELLDQYTTAISEQIRWYAPRLAELGYSPTHVYWGGGTPTRLSARQLEQICEVLRTSFDLSATAEFALEASPESIDPDKLAVLRRAGADRISIGVQSFQNHILRSMGRAHDEGVAERAITMIKAAGFERFNIDLIAGYPDQTHADVMASVERAIELEVPHICVYAFRPIRQLVSVRQVSRGHRHLDDYDRRLAAYLDAKQRLEAAGYEEYMANYFARSPRQYFGGDSYYYAIRGEFFGFGAGAQSIIGGHAFKRSSDIQRGAGIGLPEFLADPTSMVFAAPAEQVPSEPLLMVISQALTTKDGVVFERFADLTRRDFHEVRKQAAVRLWLQSLVKLGAEFVETEHALSLTPATRDVPGVHDVFATPMRSREALPVINSPPA